jgi:hypothetical protein
MLFRLFLGGLLWALMGLELANAQDVWLVTPEEVQREAAWAGTHPPSATRRTRAITPANPEIAVVKPESLAEPLKAPFPIQILFRAREGAVIVPESLRILYGFMRIDITERLTARAKVTPAGIVVESAAIPPGNHRLLIRVSDDRERQGEAELRFAVQ